MGINRLGTSTHADTNMQGSYETRGDAAARLSAPQPLNAAQTQCIMARELCGPGLLASVR